MRKTKRTGLVRLAALEAEPPQALKPLGDYFRLSPPRSEHSPNIRNGQPRPGTAQGNP